MKRWLPWLPWVLWFAAGFAFAALPSSGTITLSQIQAEFGGSNPIGLSEYYRGGGLVPNTGPNAGIPTSGQISLSNFYGGVGVGVNLAFINGASFIESFTTPGSSGVVAIQNDSNAYYAGFPSTGGALVFIGQWLAGGSASGYDVQLTVLSGSNPTSGSAISTWLNCATNRSWSLTKSTMGTLSGSWKLEIRDASTLVVLASATFSISATMT